MPTVSKIKEKLASPMKPTSKGKGKAKEDVPEDLKATGFDPKKKGTFAERRIKQGTRIIKDKVTLEAGDGGSYYSIYYKFLHVGSTNLQNEILNLSYRKETKDEKMSEVNDNFGRVLELCKGPKGPVKKTGHRSVEHAATVLAIWNDNKVQLQRGITSDLVLQIARINHSCCPNVAVSWNETVKCYVVHALRDIEKGDEIVYSYIYLPQVREDRQQQLWRQWGIRCKCPLCNFDCLSKAIQQQTFNDRDRQERAGRPGLQRKTTGHLNNFLWWETDGPQGCENRREEYNKGLVSTNRSQENLLAKRTTVLEVGRRVEYYREMKNMLQPEEVYLVEELANM